MPIDDTVTVITSHAPATQMSVHTMPSAGCCMTEGAFVSGQRSKHSTRNITASAVTMKTSAITAMNMPCGADCR